MSWEEVYKTKLNMVKIVIDHTIAKLNMLSDPGEMASVAIDALNEFSTLVSPD